MRCHFFLLVLAAACSRPLSPLSLPLAPGEVIVVGRIELIPPLAPGEQELFDLNTDFDTYYLNKAFLLSGKKGCPAYLPSYPFIAEASLSHVDVVTLGETFFLKTREPSFFLCMSAIPLRAGRMSGTKLYQVAFLPNRAEVKIPPGDQAVYVGTLQYHRDDSFQITQLSVKDDYEQASRELDQKLGVHLPLREALLKLPRSEETFAAKESALPSGLQIGPALPTATSSEGQASTSVKPEREGPSSLAALSEESSATTQPAPLLEESAGGGLWTFDPPPYLSAAITAERRGETPDTAPAHARGSLYHKSPLLSFALSTTTLLAGYGLFRPSLESGNVVTLLISSTLLTIGPSAGHLYAGEDLHALITSGLRLLCGLVAVADFATPGDDDLAWLMVIAFDAISIYDVLDSRKAPRREKARLKRRALSPAPSLSLDGEASLSRWGF